MKWIKFEDGLRERFLKFIKRECAPLFEILNPFERTYFYHFWHKILNEHECFLLSDGASDRGFASKPQWLVKHWMRWPENYLLVKDGLSGNFRLPPCFKKERFYRTNDPGNIKRFNFEISQTSYACDLDKFAYHKVKGLNRRIVCHELEADRTDEIVKLLDINQRDADVKSGFYERYYLPVLIENIKTNYKDRYGFGFYATKKNSTQPIAFCFYDGFEMPLTGTPCLLVNDIIVKPEFRRQRIATSLQAFAYDRLKTKHIRWILGNIETGNTSSIKQARALGRFPWASMGQFARKT